MKTECRTKIRYVVQTFVLLIGFLNEVKKSVFESSVVGIFRYIEENKKN